MNAKEKAMAYDEALNGRKTMTNHMPNIRHKNVISAEDFVNRCNLYATWIHLLNSIIQSVAGQWHHLAKAAGPLKGAWRIQSDAQKAVAAIQSADKHLDRFEEKLDAVDIAEWRNIRDRMVKVHDAEQREINLFIRFFGIYYKDFFGKQENQEKLWDFMEKFTSDEVSDGAYDVFALNYIYSLNIEDDEKSAQ